MIYIGLAGWGDHDTIYPNGSAQKQKLKEYAAHFPIVEVDSTFYAIPSENSVRKWINDTPNRFQFIVKAYQGMTGHGRGNHTFTSREEMFTAFLNAILPFYQSGKLGMILLQFPPWFDCQKKHVDYLRFCKEQLKDMPIALEFRHQSWFYPQFNDATLEFMKSEGWIHSICDEPQIGQGSVPTILKATHPLKTLVRFHGRNVYGWRKPNNGNWREVRYLYRYNHQELIEWQERLLLLEKQTEDIYIIFNNNSGGDAADNAKQLINILSIEYSGLAPKQLDLF
ncbi:DUF72 domain-containing protein [Heyndrickxia oleronia]|uniref:DUF72 domain-containing protein n=1 Tax=Heyndrickxia oleronia TaxID=38875 RepID=UPI00203AB3A1|nr:DUF72 domain-containing protein [Heyndrickxia oleronia]MCM3238176.1 DUF72 domain-containing protein [Heyndrickxia oleronia]